MSTVLDSLSIIQSYNKNDKGNVLPLHTSGPLFKDLTGKIVRMKGVTQFQLLDWYSKGTDITPIFRIFDRSNYIRIFNYTPIKEWGDKSWDIPSISATKNFINLCSDNGFYVEITLLTDDDPRRISEAQNIVSQLKNFTLPNLLLEIGNEPLTHKDIKVEQLKSVCESSGYLYSSGMGDEPSRFFGTYGTTHTPRDNEWVRKGKDLDEFYGFLKVPWLSDEPIRPDQAGYNELDYYTYGALCGLMGAGALFHYQSWMGSVDQPIDEQSLKCYDAMMSGLELYPEDAVIGGYEHLRDMEKVDSSGTPTAALRVFRKGEFAIVIRNKSVDIPSNWQPLDDKKVCYKIS